LWEDMRKYFEEKPLPYQREAFVRDFHQCFFAMCGKALGCERMTHVARYVTVGMSKGMVSHTFWAEKALPLLLQRLADYTGGDI